MTIQHHLDEATLLAYSSGTLSEAFNLIVATHLSLCAQCRAEAERLDALGGALLDDTATADLSPDSLEHTLALLERPTAKSTTKAQREPGTLPAPLQDYVGGDLDAIKWRPVGMGVKHAVLPTSSKATARLLFIPAGAAMPDHSHEGTEMTLVLQGAFLDDEDRFARGDIELADGHVTHTPIADVGEDCICLAVTEAPLVFKGWLPRLMQRFVGI